MKLTKTLGFFRLISSDCGDKSREIISKRPFVPKVSVMLIAMLVITEGNAN